MTAHDHRFVTTSQPHSGLPLADIMDPYCLECGREMFECECNELEYRGSDPSEYREERR